MSNTNENQKSELEKFKLFYEHTDDSRVLIHRQRTLRQARKTTASRR